MGHHKKYMDKFKKYKERIALALSEINLPGAPERLYSPILYTLDLGGKRLRPVLALYACELFGGDPEDAVDAASGLEIFHNFTLLHDDIMDNAPIRRGKQTVYKKWNSNIAILSGDTMFALAYRQICKTKPDYLPKILEIFSNTAIQVCEGQQFDMDFEERNDVSIKEYIRMIMLKTAVLLGASLKIGAVIGKADTNDTEKIYDFGVNVGIAFQLMDDRLDTFGSEDKFGKSIGGDIVANKKTYLYLKSLEIANATDRKTLIDCFFNSTMSPDKKVRIVKGIYEKYMINELTRDEMEKYFIAATEILEQLNAPKNKKNALLDFTKSLIRREH